MCNILKIGWKMENEVRRNTRFLVSKPLYATHSEKLKKKYYDIKLAAAFVETNV